MQWSQWCWTVSCRIWTRSHALQCNAQEPTETVTYWKIFKTFQNNLLWGSPRHHQNSLSFKICIKLYITPAHLHLLEPILHLGRSKGCVRLRRSATTFSWALRPKETHAQNNLCGEGDQKCITKELSKQVQYGAINFTFPIWLDSAPFLLESVWIVLLWYRLVLYIGNSGCKCNWQKKRTFLVLLAGSVPVCVEYARETCLP